MTIVITIMHRGKHTGRHCAIIDSTGGKISKPIVIVSDRKMFFLFPQDCREDIIIIM